MYSYDFKKLEFSLFAMLKPHASDQFLSLIQTNVQGSDFREIMIQK